MNNEDGAPALRTVLVAALLMAASPDDVAFERVFYPSGKLRIEGYIYRPAGDGPFPVVIYNHGSREGEERSERPFPHVGRLLTAAGYAVLVPERRGYGQSDGPVFRDEIGRDRGPRFVTRLQEESGDVLAALDYLKTVPGLDPSRIAIMGWSFGGMVSVFAASRSDRFFAVVDQAGGSLTWPRSPAIQSALPDAAKKIRAPILCMVAENDATTESVKRVCEAARKKGTAATLTIYPPFTPPQVPPNVAPGHMIFSAAGLSRWGSDVVAFLDQSRPR